MEKRENKDINSKNKSALFAKIGVALAGVLLVVLIGMLIRNQVIKDKQQAVMNAVEQTIEEQEESQVQFLLDSGYVNLVDAMERCGYVWTANMDAPDNPTRAYTFQKQNGNMEIEVEFDFQEQTCKKNQYNFDMTDCFLNLRDTWYVKASRLDDITNASMQNVDYTTHPWTEARLIAHAGGTYRDAFGGYFSNYTNSYESMVQNYNLGCRVFEFDFALTTDGRLAAVHDWKKHGNMDGNAMSSADWSAVGAVAKPLTPGTYTSIFLEDILDQMLVNEDMYLVTDVKFEDMTEDEVRQQFEVLYEAAMDKEPALLNRIVPQIYTEEMYDWLMEIYPFPSVIFTCYKTDENAQDIINFCASKDNIPVITTKYEALPLGTGTDVGPSVGAGEEANSETSAEMSVEMTSEDTESIDESGLRFTSQDIADLHAKGLLIYNYTVSSFTKMYDCLARGVDGIYSNNLLPQDFAVFDTVK